MKNNSRKNIISNGGRFFTFVELVFALALISMLAAVALGMQRMFVSSWGIFSERQEIFRELLDLDRSFNQFFDGCAGITVAAEGNRRKPFFSGTDEEVRFVYLFSTDENSESAIRFVWLWLDNEGRLLAGYRDRPPKGLNLDPEDRISVLARNVANLAIKYAEYPVDYASSSQLVWLDEWNVQSLPGVMDQPRRIPAGIMITVTWKDGRRETWLRRLAGAGYMENPGVWSPLIQP